MQISFNKEEIFEIITLLFKRLEKRLLQKQITLSVTERAKEHIRDEAYDPIYGARPLKRYIQSHIETLICIKIIHGAISDGSQITVDFDGEDFQMN